MMNAISKQLFQNLQKCMKRNHIKLMLYLRSIKLYYPIYHTTFIYKNLLTNL